MEKSSCTNQYKQIEAMLYGYKRSVAEIKILQLEIERVINDYNGIKIPILSEISSNTNQIQSPVEKEIEMKEKTVETLNITKREIEINILKIEAALSILTKEESDVIAQRYFFNESFRDIAARMNKYENGKVYDDAVLSRIRTKAIKEKIIPFMSLKNYFAL